MTDKMKDTEKSVCDTCVKSCKYKGVLYCPAYQDTVDQALNLFDCGPRDDRKGGVK